MPVPPDPASAAPQRRIDPTTLRPILLAPQRQLRPMHTLPHQGEKACPFCPGEEHQTPPALQALPSKLPSSSNRNQPGWTARAFPNLYPACAVHEVIAEGAIHGEQPSDLSLADFGICVELWLQRIAAIEAMPDIRTAFWFKNVGAAAGASIAHNHSQLLGLSELPPRLQLELAVNARSATCLWCDALAAARQDDRILVETSQHVVLVPDPPRLPNETWLLPKRCCDDLLTTDRDSLAQAFHQLLARLATHLRRPAFNCWLHRVPNAAFHWHFEIQPRTGQLAGLELGGDMYINSVPARDIMRRLRGQGG